MLVLDFWGDDTPVPFGTPFWSIPIDAGRRTIERTLWPHVLTLQALTPLLIDRPAAAGQPPRVVVVRCRRPGALLPHEPLLRSRRHAADSSRLCGGRGARPARHHGARGVARLCQDRVHARALRRDRGQLARRRPRRIPDCSSQKRRAFSDAASRRSRRIPHRRAGPAACTGRGISRAPTACATSMAERRTSASIFAASYGETPSRRTPRRAGVSRNGRTRRTRSAGVHENGGEPYMAKASTLERQSGGRCWRQPRRR